MHIRQEADHARAGRPARIIAKVNSLIDPALIDELYLASQAGVQIDLIVRGMCSLRPGVPEVSDRIRVLSVVDRYLSTRESFAFITTASRFIFWHPPIGCKGILTAALKSPFQFLSRLYKSGSKKFSRSRLQIPLRLGGCSRMVITAAALPMGPYLYARKNDYTN